MPKVLLGMEEPKELLVLKGILVLKVLLGVQEAPAIKALKEIRGQKEQQE